ncbi:MAG: hypothetical protein XU08_C0003G0007 [candidate division WWE3 bacterium CSP1-7]|uniref:Uncharacterized protein n=1 Tax=candidate division WWE3 bacterium CSP1-7 TaxID=1576480 RepID=A0A0T5ZX15_UNCKA|nr:MAG: hypothetical protein XU08_C0003G0007 [candidate division WWE3 bacterium CSP1-7]
MLKTVKTIAASATALIFSALPIFAIENPITAAEDIPGLIGLVFNAILGIVGALALILLALGGIQYMTSGGDKIAVEQARGRITSAVVGLVIVFGAWLVINFIGNILTGKPLI